MALGPVAGGWGDSFPIHTSIKASAMTIPNPVRIHLKRNVCVPPFSGTSRPRETQLRRYWVTSSTFSILVA